MNRELKPCPFCGGEAVINVIEPHEHVVVNLPPYPGGAFIECTGCTCAMSGQSEEEVIKAWNTRKPIDKVVERLEELETYKQTVTMEKHPFCASEIETVSKKKAVEIVKGNYSENPNSSKGGAE